MHVPEDTTCAERQASQTRARVCTRMRASKDLSGVEGSAKRPSLNITDSAEHFAGYYPHCNGNARHRREPEIGSYTPIPTLARFDTRSLT